jgi:hypothetical protein
MRLLETESALFQTLKEWNLLQAWEPLATRGWTLDDVCARPRVELLAAVSSSLKMPHLNVFIEKVENLIASRAATKNNTNGQVTSATTSQQPKKQKKQGPSLLEILTSAVHPQKEEPQEETAGPVYVETMTDKSDFPVITQPINNKPKSPRTDKPKQQDPLQYVSVYVDPQGKTTTTAHTVSRSGTVPHLVVVDSDSDSSSDSDGTPHGATYTSHLSKSITRTDCDAFEKHSDEDSDKKCAVLFLSLLLLLSLIFSYTWNSMSGYISHVAAPIVSPNKNGSNMSNITSHYFFFFLISFSELE